MYQDLQQQLPTIDCLQIEGIATFENQSISIPIVILLNHDRLHIVQSTFYAHSNYIFQSDDNICLFMTSLHQYDCIFTWSEDEMSQSSLCWFLIDQYTQRWKIYAHSDQIAKLRAFLGGLALFARPKNTILAKLLYKNSRSEVRCLFLQDQKQYVAEKVEEARPNTENLEIVTNKHYYPQKLGKELKIMRVLKQYPHPNILQLKEIWIQSNQVSFTSEFCSGGTLFSYFNENGQRIEKTLLKSILQKLLQALAHFHQHGIVHRDIKLQNIYLRNKKEPADVVLGDFGYACYAQETTNYISSCGSKGYMAPEQLTGSDQKSQKMDIFSLGVVFYYLLTGKSPFGKMEHKNFQANNIMGVYDKSALDKLNVESSAQDLIRAMLESDQRRRLSAAECLNHVYFKEAASLTHVIIGQKTNTLCQNIIN